MNSNPASSSNNRQPTPLQHASRVVRIFLFGCMAYVIWFLVTILYQAFRGAKAQGHWGIDPNGYSLATIVMLVSGSTRPFILFAWYWTLARLFGHYANGQVFSLEPIRCIRRAGILCIAGWAFDSVSHLAFLVWRQSAGVAIPQSDTVTIKPFQMGYFEADFGTGINFGMLIAGIIIVLVASIMAEGKKLHEEQALTV